MSAPAGAEIVAALIRLRVKQRLTQQQIADMCGVARPTIARFESEATRCRTPSLMITSRYAAAVGARITLEIDK